MQTNFRLTAAAKALLVLSTLSGLLVATPAVAAVDMFMQINKVKGESTDKAFKEASDVLAWSWGASNSGSGGGGGGGGAGKASFQDLAWTQYIDSSIPPLFLGLAKGDHFEHATLSVRHRGATPFVFLTIRFDDVLISSLSMGGSSGEDRLTTNVTMMPLEKITLTYWPRDPKGGQGTAIEAAWSLAENQEARFSGNPEAVFGLFLAGQTLNLTDLPLTPDPTPIPEPQTWLMFGLGLAGLAGWQRRRQRVADSVAALPA